ncbi:MAG: hypothetical protein H6962_14040 [Chromatiaceae bacterium]|nr:hypothetical protein [Chromatiaceae bacterium]
MQGNPDSAVPLDQLEYQLVELLVELAHGYLRLANELLRGGKRAGADPVPRNEPAGQRHQHRAPALPPSHTRRLAPAAQRLRACSGGSRQQSAGHKGGGVGTGGEPDTVRGLFFRSWWSACATRIITTAPARS